MKANVTNIRKSNAACVARLQRALKEVQESNGGYQFFVCCLAEMLTEDMELTRDEMDKMDVERLAELIRPFCDELTLA